MQKKKLNKDEIKILVCCHKKAELPNDPDGILLPIQVGAAISDIDLDMQHDDKINNKKCDNISNKNQSYCELTALYWSWKNIEKIYPNIKYIGLFHYRRFMNFKSKTLFPKEYRSISDIEKYNISIKDIEEKLTDNVILLPKQDNLIFPPKIQYCINHYSDDFYKLDNIIKNNYNEYYHCFDYFFNKTNKINFYNMAIMPIEIFKDYCEWLFSILTKLENETNIENYSPVQKRLYGYIAERLLNVYCLYMKYKNKTILKYFPVTYFSEEKNTNSLFRYIIMRIKSFLILFIIKPKFHKRIKG